MNSIFQRLYDEAGRIDRVIFLAGALGAGDALPRDLEEFFDDEDDATIHETLGEVPDWVDLDSRGYQRAEAVGEWLVEAKKFGFLAQFTTPVMTPTGEGSRSYSWGYYFTTWVYGDTMEEVMEKGLAWIAERREAEDAKAAAVKERKV